MSVGTGNRARVSSVPFTQLGFRTNIRQIRQIPIARSRNHVRASTTKILMFPRARSIRVAVSPGSLHVSICHSSKPNNRDIGAASSTIHVARIPANIIISYRGRGSRLRGGRRTVQVLHTHLITLTRRRGRTRTSTAHGRRIHAISHSRHVHACGFPRGQLSSRHANFGTCGLRAILTNRLSPIVRSYISTSLRTHLRSTRSV